MRTIIAFSLLCLGLGLSACQPSPPSNSSADASASLDGPSQVQQETQAQAQVLQNPDYIQANKYFAEGRIHAPAGANAIESFLKARQSFSSPQQGVEDAMEDMEPYLVIAIEKAITDQNASEAKRLMGLLKAMNSKAPSIPRLEQQIAKLTPMQ